MDDHVSLWDEEKVAQWLRSVDLGEFADVFIVNDVNGSVLSLLDHNSLREMNITSVGKRLLILKAVEDLLKESKKDETSEGPPVPSKREKEKDELIIQLQTQLAEMKKALSYSMDQNKSMYKKPTTPKEKMLLEVSSADEDPLRPRKKSLIMSVSEKFKKDSKPKVFVEVEKSMDSRNQSPDTKGEKGTIKIYGNSLTEFNHYKTIAVTIHDTCQKVLESALLKFGINDKWEKFTLFMHFDGKERSLRYDEIPLQLKRDMKIKGEELAFAIRNIRQLEDIDQNALSKNDVSRIATNTQSAKRNMLKKEIDVMKKETVLEKEYAVVIYEYKAELEDEISISIGDKLKVLRRATGWWYVEKDGNFGWTPSGCLDEDHKEEEDDGYPKKGIVLYDYDAEGANELSISKGDIITIFKSHQHWYLADSNGKEGWIPSCYINLQDDVTSIQHLMRPSSAKFPFIRPLSELETSDKELEEFNLLVQDKSNTQSREEIDLIVSDYESSDYNDDSEFEIRSRVRDSIQRLSQALEYIPNKDNFKRNMKKSLEEIDIELQKDPNEKIDATSINARITRMVQELESMEIAPKTNQNQATNL